MSYIAIDIGGTAIKVGIVNEGGEISHQYNEEIPTPLDAYETLMIKLKEIIIWAKENAQIKGIALSQPCATDADSGLSLSEGALIYIKGKNIAKDLGDFFNLPYSAENDGNCAALAEVWQGAAKDVSDMAFVVCGTGIGGAIVKARQVHAGFNKFAGEFGMCFNGVDEETGLPVLWSDNGSTFALVKDYAKRVGKSPSTLNGKMVFDLADKGDQVALACVNRFYVNFAMGVHNVQHVYDPELILIGGGISARHDLLDNIYRCLDGLYENIDLLMSRPRLKTCTMGAEANLIGAVYHLITKK